MPIIREKNPIPLALEVGPFFKRPSKKITTPFIPRLSGGGIFILARN